MRDSYFHFKMGRLVLSVLHPISLKGRSDNLMHFFLFPFFCLRVLSMLGEEFGPQHLKLIAEWESDVKEVYALTFVEFLKDIFYRPYCYI